MFDRPFSTPEDYTPPAVPLTTHSVEALFEQVAAAQPDAPAILCGPDTFTYAQLHALATDIARCLVKHEAANQERPVAIWLPACPEVVAAMLAVLKAGGFYVIIDPGLPPARQAAIVDNSQAVWGITTPAHRTHVEQYMPAAHILDTFTTSDTPELPPGTIVPVTGRGALVYTSGSTGTPKGVVHSRAYMLQWSDTYVRDLCLAPSDCVSLLYAPGVAGAIRDIYGAILTGARLCILNPRDQSLDTIADQLLSQHVTIYHSVATLFRHLMLAADDAVRFTDVRAIAFGGERVLARDMDLIRTHFAEDTMIYGSIGSTETGTFARLFLPTTEHDIGTALPLGTPPPCRTVVVLDPDGKEVAPGEVGQIVVRGPHLADGYWRQQELTDKVFQPDPDTPGERQYLTGDRGYRDEQGLLHYAGRTDRQFNIRGNRVEAGDVEAVLLTHPEVRNAIAMMEPTAGEPVLVAHVEGSTNLPELDERVLREHCTSALADYMVPTRIYRHHQFPRLPNGKTDMRALLPAPPAAADAGEVESALAQACTVREVWGACFPAASLTDDSHFFSLGGHSLLAMRAIAHLRTSLNVDIPPRLIYEQPTLAAFEAAVAACSPLAAGATAIARLERHPDSDPVLRAPVSFNQEALWLLHHSVSQPGAYNIPHCFVFEASLDANHLATALRALTQRHESLRTVFRMIDDTLSQVVLPEADWPLEVIPLGSDDSPETHPRFERAARAPFDLASGPLVRAVLGHAPTHSALLLVFHHGIVDGWSLRLLYHELGLLYSGEADRMAPAADIQPADFAAWQRHPDRMHSWQQDTAFWSAQLTPAADPLELPADRQADAREAQAGSTVTATIDGTVVERARTFAAEQNVTLFMLLLTVYATLLHRHSGQKRFVIGIPAAGRPFDELSNTVGYFINTLPLMLDMDGTRGFHDQLKLVAAACTNVYAHADIPGALIRNNLPESAREAPLFNTLFLLQDLASRELALGTHRARGVTLHNQTAKYPFSMLLYPEADGIHMQAEFSNGQMSETLAQQLLAQFEALLIAAMQPADTPLHTLAMAEPDTLADVAAWSHRQTPYPREQPVGRRFLEQAAATPDRVALSQGDEQMTYAELERRALAAAAELLRMNLPQHAHVGIFGARGFDRIVHALAVLLVGGVYVPLNSLAPADRLQTIAEDAELWGVFGLPDGHIPWLPKDVKRLAMPDTGTPALVTDLPDVAASDPAYLMYTSGSTGVPKGALIPHRGIMRLVCGNDFVPLGPDTVMLQLASFAFDAATLEIWGPLLNGGRVAVPPAGQLSPSEIGDAIAAQKVTTLWLTAGLFHVVIDEAIDILAPLEHLLAGGDVLSVPHVQRLRECYPDLHLVNGYGPTENTTFTCCHTIDTRADDTGSIPIGRPICNTRVAVMDAWQQPCPPGVAGELWMAGDGLSLGYWKRPDLNAERFVTGPDGDRWYRSGDIVRWTTDGILAFIGRRDTQVKIRGFRVELDAIREALRRQPDIQDATVRPWAFAPDDKLLTAYVIAPTCPVIDAAQLQALLARTLPPYEIPAFIIAVDTFPLNASGKVDLKRLPPPPADTTADTADGEPMDETETAIADIYRDLFPGRPISRDADFFALGGDSLSAARVMARIESRFNVKVGLTTLYWNPTISGLAAAIDKGNKRTQASEFLVPLRGVESEEAPLFLVHGVRGDVFAFQDLARSLPEDLPVFGICRSTDDVDPDTESVTTLAAQYADAITAQQPAGPYRIGGYSIGGVLAHAIAAELTSRGERVQLLALFDTRPVNLPTARYALVLLPYLAHRLVHHTRQTLHALRSGDAGPYLRARLAALRRHLVSRNRATKTPDPAPTAPQSLQSAEDPFEQIVRRHTPTPYEGPAHLFKARDTHYALEVAWRYLARDGVRTYHIPGQHLTILAPEYTSAIARAVTQAIEDTSRTGAT